LADGKQSLHRPRTTCCMDSGTAFSDDGASFAFMIIGDVAE
jgi:hypothetical protein